MKLRDCDGDIWEGDDKEGWNLVMAMEGDPVPVDGENFIRNRNILFLYCGPLEEVEDE
ncbi:hypothetical protein ACFWNC_14830 [Streptomyces sp. NPDC058369]|uniref:hypothetical protein n=1 Tax=Streptomyces sp. NPDC058369 TaxID=3346462 RepID=UPI0036634752